MNYGHLQEDFLRSKEFQQVMDQANAVTLQEVMHMRHVLTSASLENLPLDSCIKEDVINGKVIEFDSKKNQTFNYHSTDCLAFQVCFVCRKTRFSVFGSWWHNCKLCRRTICTKCCTKVNKSKAKQSKHRTPHHSAFQSTCGCTDADTIGTICQRARLHFVQRPIDVSHAVFPLLQPPD